MAYPSVDKLICVSKNLGESVKRHFGKDYIVIHNLFNIELLKPVIKRTNNIEFTISAVGSLIPRKGFDILIKAIAASSLRSKPVKVNIYGRGPSHEDLQQLIQSSGLSDKINLCGQKSKAELYEELRKSDLFVLSSRLENFSVAMIEATGNGLPAIATLCGGIEEYPVPGVDKIKTDDIEEMKNALEKAYLNKDNIDREQIQKETIKYFSPKAIIAQVEKVYEDALKEKGI